MNKYKIILIIILLHFLTPLAVCENNTSVLHDKCIDELYIPAKNYFHKSKIKVFRDSRGLILRFYTDDFLAEYYCLSKKTMESIFLIKTFLAKIKNTAIIEVHVHKLSSTDSLDMKLWEISTVVANNIEDAIEKDNRELANRTHSVGYGEFLPEKNPPNNGGKLSGRVDIIILCNVSGE